MLVQQAKMRVRSATIDDLHRISPGNGPIILSITIQYHLQIWEISITMIARRSLLWPQKRGSLTPEKQKQICPLKPGVGTATSMRYACQPWMDLAQKKTTTVWLVVPNKQTSENRLIRRKWSWQTNNLEKGL